MLDTQPGHDTIDFITLRNYLQTNRHIKAVSSHRLHPPVKYKGTLPIVLLRHPADRARSAYRYARQNSLVPDHALASTHDFRAYVDWSLNTRGEGAMLRDYQVQYLSNRRLPHAGLASLASDPGRSRAGAETSAAFARLRLGAPLRRVLPPVQRGPIARFCQPCIFMIGARTTATRLTRASPTRLQTYVMSSARSPTRLFAPPIRSTWPCMRLPACCSRKTCGSWIAPTTRVLLPMRLLAGRARRALADPRGGIGSVIHPSAPAYIRLPPDTSRF